MTNTRKTFDLSKFNEVRKLRAKVIARFDDKSFCSMSEDGTFRFYIVNDTDYMRLKEVQVQCFELENSLENAKSPEEKDELKQEIKKLEKEITFLSRPHSEYKYYVDSSDNPQYFLDRLQEEYIEGKSVFQIMWALGCPSSSVDFQDNRPLPKGYSWELKGGN